ncbi:Extracellular serine protease precursor [Stieleria neptunia]|uniref:Extracellular serine protease n=1 Tax=Stieleria neptunia TaxID=2527979 RepID=A0A518HTV2_9BACT|nr:Extracellular serine protease precursor [Stieleria neptunia]
MSHPYRWASRRLSRRAKSNRRNTASRPVRLRRFQLLESRVVLDATLMLEPDAFSDSPSPPAVFGDLAEDPLPVSAEAAYTASSLAELRALGTTVNASTVTLSTSGGDPHPVTGVVTPGVYWINGDHIADPANSEPIFLELGGSNNTYDLTGTSINLDTRKLDGFGRRLGHDSGVRVVKVSGDGNTVTGLQVTGHDLAMDTDPNAQRHADWAAVYIQMTGSGNTVDGVNVLTRGSTPYGYGDVFGKGARKDPQGWPPGPALDENGDPVGDGVGLPWIAHRKTSAFQVIDAVNAVVNDMHLDVKTYGHGFFVQGTSDNTTLTNSTVTGELFSSNDVIATDLYQDYGFTSHGNVLAPDMMISGAEDGVRMYSGPTGLTVNNVVVTNMRTGFSVALGRGTMTLDNVEAYGTENAFNFKTNTTITNAKGDITHGPLLYTPYDSSRDSSIEVELVGGVPEGVDWAVAYVAGNNIDVTIDSDVPAGALPEDSLVRFGQVFSTNWRDTKHPTGPDDGASTYDYINSTFHNNTNQMMVLGIEVTGNQGSSQAGVISNGKDNQYDGVTVVLNDSRLLVQHVNGLGNNGTAADGTLESNASIVADGGTLEIQPGIRITNEKLTISGDGVDGKGALYSEGSANSGTRFGSSNNGDESTLFLDGDASIGVGVQGNQLLVGRIQGTGTLTKLGAGKLSMEKSSTFDGSLVVAEGHVTGRTGVVHRELTVAAAASISAISNNTFNTQGDVLVDGLMDLNSRTGASMLPGKVGRLLGSGQVVSTNPFEGAGARLEIAFGSDDAIFSGQIATAVSLVKSDTGTQTLAGNNTYAGTTTVNGGVLQIDGAHTGGGDYTVNAGGTLGGNGTIGSAVIVNAGGHLAPGASAGTLSVDDLTLSPDAHFDVELGGTTAGSGYDRLLASSATLGGVLSVSLLDLGDGMFQPLPTDTFTVLVSEASLSGAFDNVASGQRLETLGGEGTFRVTYGGPANTVVLSDYQLVPYDYGDAPASYGTLVGDDGARHRGTGPRLGETRDLETDGQPSADADGDGSDEDGVLFGNIGIGNPMAGVNIDLQNADNAKVDAWIDFDRDGIWQADEQILADAPVIAGLQTLNYDLPAAAPTGQTVARVRLSSNGGLQPVGSADDGEVEDYVVMIGEAVDPAVESVVINQGQSQRSRVSELTVTFNTDVTAATDAFSVRNRSTHELVNLALSSEVQDGKTVATLTFLPGPSVVNAVEGRHTLDDGNYELVVTGALIDAGGRTMNHNHPFGDQAADSFFRYYGDTDGDRDVDGQDYGRFGATFLRPSSDPAFDPALDADGDLDVDGQDYGRFGQRFSKRLGF